MRRERRCVTWGRAWGVAGRLLALGLLLAPGACTRVGTTSPQPTPVPPAPRVDPPAVEAPRPGPEAVPRPVPRRFAEVRALWVVRTTLAGPESVRTMVRQADEAGFNTLIVQVRGRGDAWYRSPREPRAEALAGQPDDFDPLGLVVALAHDRGMAVHAWVNTHLVADAGRLPRAPEHVVNRSPDLLAVPRSLADRLAAMGPFDPARVAALAEHARANRNTVEGLFTSPSHPAVQDRVVDVWTDILRRYPVDGIHFDYVRYPGPAWDYSAGALEAFRAWAGARVSSARAAALDRGARRDRFAWPDGEPALWDDFRREQITGLVRRVHREAKRLRSDLVVSAAVFADRADARAARYQDWGKWLQEGILDVAVPMAYTPDDGRFRELVAGAVAAAGDPRRVWAGIGVYRTTFEGTLSKIDLAREVGAGGVSLFSYDWAVSQGEARYGVPFLERVGRRAFRR